MKETEEGRYLYTSLDILKGHLNTSEISYFMSWIKDGEAIIRNELNEDVHSCTCQSTCNKLVGEWQCDHLFPVCSSLHYTTETACVTQGTWDGSCDISSGGREIDEAKCIAAVGIWGDCSSGACCTDGSSR